MTYPQDFDSSSNPALIWLGITIRLEIMLGEKTATETLRILILAAFGLTRALLVIEDFSNKNGSLGPKNQESLGLV